MGEHSLPEPATQVAHPWRAVVRTIFQLVVGLALAMPTLVTVLDLPPSAGLTAALGIAAAITRVMAIPAIDALLQRWLPWLATSPGDDG